MCSENADRAEGDAPVRSEGPDGDLFSQSSISFISHEVGNPVASLTGFLDLVLEGKAGPLTPLQAEFLTLSRLSASRLCRLVADVSDIGLLARGLLPLGTENANLRAIVAAVVEQLEPLASTCHIELANRFRDEAPIRRIDAKRLERSLLHIVTFALQLTPSPGRVVISGEVGERKLILTVAGMASARLPAEYAKVFSPDGGRWEAGRRDATWLGLTVARQVIELHGGEVWLDGQRGGVAKIRLKLPVGEGSAR